MSESISEKLFRTFSAKSSAAKSLSSSERLPGDQAGPSKTGQIAELETPVQQLPIRPSASVQSELGNAAETSASTPSTGTSASIQPNVEVLRDLEIHARSISSNIDVALRDLRGSLRSMSDLTLESMQAFGSSINSSCDAVDSAIKSTYSVLAKAEEFKSSMKDVRKLTEQIKDMKRVVDLFEAQLLAENEPDRK